MIEWFLLNYSVKGLENQYSEGLDLGFLKSAFENIKK